MSLNFSLKIDNIFLVRLEVLQDKCTLGEVLKEHDFKYHPYADDLHKYNMFSTNLFPEF